MRNMHESDYFKDFIFIAIKKYLSGNKIPFNNFLITTNRFK